MEGAQLSARRQSSLEANTDRQLRVFRRLLVGSARGVNGMRPGSSLSRRSVLLITIMSPALLGSYFKCVAVSNPTVATARIEQLEPLTLRVGDVMQVTGAGNGAPPLQFAWDFGDGSQAAGMQAAHAYLTPGSYRITLTVRDAVGNIARDTSQVDVSARLSSAVLSLVLSSQDRKSV